MAGHGALFTAAVAAASFSAGAAAGACGHGRVLTVINNDSTMDFFTKKM